MTKLEYFFTEEEEKRCRNEEEHELLPILEVPPYIPFDFDAFALIERYALLTTKECYFDCQFEEDPNLRPLSLATALITFRRR